MDSLPGTYDIRYKIDSLPELSLPNWIRIQSDQWIRIRISFRNPDPDPGGQKLPEK
jgi:hypothetical protein